MLLRLQQNKQTTLGAKRAVLLPVSVPSHSCLMREAAEKFARQFDAVAFAEPQVPVVQNTQAKSYATIDEIKLALQQQLYSPVQWVESVEALADTGVSVIYEFGPGRVLSGLIRRIDRSLKTGNISDNKSLDKALQDLQEDVENA